MKLQGPLQQQFSNRQVIVSIAMWLLTIAIAMGVVYSKHVSRILHAEIQALKKQGVALHNDKGMLLLEKATWTADSRIEQIARNRLGMTMPAKLEMIKP